MMMSGGVSPKLNYVGSQVKGIRIADLTKYADTGIITGLKVIWNNYIIGLEILFNGQSSGVVKGNINQFWEENFNLQLGDYIIEIYGRATSNVINCFGIKTVKGLTKTWGNPLEGEAFSFYLNSHYIKSLKIGVTDYLNYLEPVYENFMFLGAQLLPVLNNRKVTDLLGKQKKNSEGFDDFDWIKNKFNYSVAEIKVWHDGTFVYGVQFSYGLDGTKKTPGKHCAEKNSLMCESLILNNGEHIVKVLIRSGDWIDSLAFFTDQGRMFKAGGNGGGLYVTSAPQGQQLVALGGSNGNFLDTIQFYYDAIY